jgi:penicillin-binding protein-related factor A (putative recombinase)
MSGREKDLQDACIDYLKSNGIYYINTHGNAFERRGRPDLYICYRGHFIGVELKRGAGNAPFPLQLKHLEEINRNGGIGIWITQLNQLTDLISSLGPLTADA